MKKKTRGVLKDFAEDVIFARNKGESLQVIGMRYGVTREAVRQFLNKQGDKVTSAMKPFSLSVVDRYGTLRFFGTHLTEVEAITYFFSHVPKTSEIVGFTVFPKGEVESLRLWHGVVFTDEQFKRIGKPVFGVNRLMVVREDALSIPLPEAAEELANLIGPTESVRQGMRKFSIVKTAQGGFLMVVKRDAKKALPVVDDDLAKLLG